VSLRKYIQSSLYGCWNCVPVIRVVTITGNPRWTIVQFNTTCCMICKPIIFIVYIFYLFRDSYPFLDPTEIPLEDGLILNCGRNIFSSLFSSLRDKGADYDGRFTAAIMRLRSRAHRSGRPISMLCLRNNISKAVQSEHMYTSERENVCVCKVLKSRWSHTF